jgi:hypothetical protein
VRRVAHPFALFAKEPALSGAEGVGLPTRSNTVGRISTAPL